MFHFFHLVCFFSSGFVFTGDITHRLLTATQYIAPLMADFDPSHSKDSIVQYLDDGAVCFWAFLGPRCCLITCLTPVSCSGEMFVVQWEQVRLSRMQSKGGFTFQVALHKTGNITFGYREVGPAYSHSLLAHVLFKHDVCTARIHLWWLFSA